MKKKVTVGFEWQTVELALDDIRPTKKLEPTVKATPPYKAAVASIREAGLIEPPVVYRGPDGMYVMLDGHMRAEAMREVGLTRATCLVSTDDEAFTYNHHVSRVAPIQAHRMIMRALEAGVSEERIAKALNVTPAHVRDQRAMLKDICPEAIELLKDKPISAEALRHFRRVKAIRQVEMADLMIVAATYSAPYAEALAARTPPSERADNDKPKRETPAKAADIARMEAEIHAAESDALKLDESYGRNVVNLTLARGYVKKLIDNARVVRHLAAKHPDVLAEFQRIVELATLET